ncbi:PREDICTED: AT-rich binding protein-like [Rhagoletis zephyria]|uniref:AT-rich binding protein-like n=1 Tax=Rhagoletis zephyria TaxID=28612 RepID=UPI0008116757|nr:PREDICTED: AT-rich binding protein-like [Rhagoletis zephyria]
MSQRMTKQAIVEALGNAGISCPKSANLTQLKRLYAGLHQLEEHEHGASNSEEEDPVWVVSADIEDFAGFGASALTATLTNSDNESTTAEPAAATAEKLPVATTTLRPQPQIVNVPLPRPINLLPQPIKTSAKTATATTTTSATATAATSAATALTATTTATATAADTATTAQRTATATHGINMLGGGKGTRRRGSFLESLTEEEAALFIEHARDEEKPSTGAAPFGRPQGSRCITPEKQASLC